MTDDRDACCLDLAILLMIVLIGGIAVVALLI